MVMKLYKFQWLMGMLLLIFAVACQHDEEQTGRDLGLAPSLGDTPHLRDPSTLNSKRLSIQEAFLQLPEQELLLEGLRSLSKIERKILLQKGNSPRYACTLVGNYLEIIEKADNLEDEHEQLERLTMGVYNALTRKAIVFISQELIEEERDKKQIVQQRFLECQQGQWTPLSNTLPLVTTQTFLEEKTAPLQHQGQHFYFDLQATDVNYLQVRLQHQLYPNKDSIAIKEAYKVAYIWTGNAFQLNRQAMVQYEISERHSKQ